ncbi:DNA/RNA non-specific endonuclease [Bacteroides sp.]|uniref:DNA/RNA non-specific endonuclease n=1 Tax=Bacteroides sp. TaxID=29523 RepID=UPI001B691D9C|nr:DNA/RNA non-specific endonuclease [Bacteroides sp.]MBP6066201.1 DNA/RNA non-specific endonuclease [Bacteroides sp.]MBP6068217.1 DNA/RNA non-specific endonuclease [Bacteroides sp.]MBP6937238.1 DNA/RNA non-specific endonuclease [Bacteroides sp.]MBP8622790.1 DNA/RNA non-specific endonuclease [Bacteroides sp.]MBP9507065.1 DNA/RNA non-specific endonuclease [Bacteroides sp.]
MKTPKRRKKRSQTKIRYIIVILILIPVLYGLYLYSQQTISRTAQPTIEQYDDLEIPLLRTDQEQQLIRHTGYTVSYNQSWRIPNWVAYELTREETKGTEKRGNRFIVDPLTEGYTASNTDYARSGYDKGHMAPAADMKWSSKVMKESFYFSNICPQHPELNRRRWKDLEEKTRDWAMADSAIVIICGPIIGAQPKTIGKNQVVVPQQFFKVILSLYASSPRAIGFLFDNERSVAPLSTYAVTVDSIERLTGMDFFAPLPDEFEEQLESAYQAAEWNLN